MYTVHMKLMTKYDRTQNVQSGRGQSLGGGIRGHQMTAGSTSDSCTYSWRHAHYVLPLIEPCRAGLLYVDFRVRHYGRQKDCQVVWLNCLIIH